MNFCLIPITREESAKQAILSAEQDGWKVRTINDLNREGANTIRERLLDLALSEKATLIRYLDDDDLLLPHLKEIKIIFQNNPELDIIYTNYSIYKEQFKLTGNLLIDTIQIAPWSWIARASSVAQIKKPIWDKTKICRQGGWCWLNFLNSNLKIQHYPINAYNWQRHLFKDCIINNPNYHYESCLLRKAINHA